MSGGNSGSKGGKKTYGGKNNFRMNIEKQNKHIPNTKEFDDTKSVINLVSIEELDLLVKENISKAIDLGNGKMELELPKDIGVWKSKDGDCEVTNRVTIHRSKTGYHCVPAKRKDKKK